MRHLLRIIVIVSVISLCCAEGVFARVMPYVQGNVKILNVVGKVSSDFKEVQVGSFLKEGASVITGSDSRAVLFFDNGAAVEVGEGTNLKINRYQVVAFDASTVDYKTLRKEPSASVTKLEVTRGSIICKVPKLSDWEHNTSSYTITTPLGVGYVKGTVVHVNVSDELDTFVVTEGVVMVQKGSESFYVAGSQDSQTQQGQEVEANTENAVAISNDPNQSVPEGLLPQMRRDAQSFSNSVGQIVGANPMQGSPPQSPAPDSTDQQGDSLSGDVVGPDGVSDFYGVPSMPAPFGGGGGGSGGGGIYSN